MIEALGQPSGDLSLLNDVSLMIYGYRTTFVFRAKQLVGVTMVDYLIPYEIRGIVRPSNIDRVNWTLSNGIMTQTRFSRVKQILGLPELVIEQYQRVIFERDGTTVDRLYFVVTEALPFLGIQPPM